MYNYSVGVRPLLGVWPLIKLELRLKNERAACDERKPLTSDINPRTAGGLISAPPSGFSGVAQKRRRAAPPNFVQLFGHQLHILWKSFDLRSSQVRSQVHVKWPHLQKCLRSCQSHSLFSNVLKLAGFHKNISFYNSYISDFSYRWPKIRSIFWPPHYKWMGK